MILRSLAMNLRAGLRLALFLPLRAFDYRVSAPDYAALVGFNLLVWIAAGALRIGLDAEFDATALPLYLATVPLVLATAMLVAAAYRGAQKLLLFAVALTASDAVFEVTGLAVPYAAALTGLGASVYFLWFAWAWLVSVRAVAVCAGTQRPQFYQGALAAVQPGQPGVREQYFIGFAPDATQDVFLREMRFVKRLFEERFGAAGRVMDRDEDLLFLFISAHGDRSHRLSAAQPPLELASLTPTALARMLQDSGIKWRVVVVSACYSGGYIEPLRDDNSLVITAAAPDRSSFGCEAGRDFTYFGQAFFRDALSRTRSFIEAFHLAASIVAKQESAERLAPSAPQIFVGRGIAELLQNR